MNIVWLVNNINLHYQRGKWEHVLFPGVILRTSHKCIVCFKAIRCEFPRTGNKGPKANWDKKHVMFWWWLYVRFHRSKITQNETWALKPTTHQNMSSFNMQPNVHFNARVVRAPKTYPTKTCNVSRVMFWPHPCPMTHPWHFRLFFNFALSPCIFLLNSDVFIDNPLLEI